jgi:hypothetical protein
LQLIIKTSFIGNGDNQLLNGYGGFMNTPFVDDSKAASAKLKKNKDDKIVKDE